jgi:hypothetical protein
MSTFYEMTPNIVAAAFKKLLSEKHLYQSCELDLSPIKKFAEECEMQKSMPGSSRDMPSKRQWIDTGKKELECAWIPECDLLSPGRETVTFKVPSIMTYCEQCKDAWPHNFTGNVGLIGMDKNQCFMFEYQCQQCQTELVRFQIRREGLKIKLTGRDPIEVLPTPKELPKAMSKHFSTAHVANNAGQTLAGIFLLRTFIEQYWRSLPAVQEFIAKLTLIEGETIRATGDQIGTVYQDTLPADFRGHFPSLKEIYGKLSEAMHLANEDAALFGDCSAKIVKHFKARDIHEIP